MTKTWLVEVTRNGKTWRTLVMEPLRTRKAAEAWARHFEAAATLDGRKWKYRAVEYAPVGEKR